MADKELVCRDCGNSFMFTQGEQDFYAEKGFTNEPVRCKDCRTRKKAQGNGSSQRARSGFNRSSASRY